MLAIALVGGGLLWMARQRAEAARVVAQAMLRMGPLQETFSWAKARTELEQARDRLGPGAPVDLRERLDQAQRDLAMVARLDAIRTGSISTSWRAS